MEHDVGGVLDRHAVTREITDLEPDDLDETRYHAAVIGLDDLYTVEGATRAGDAYNLARLGLEADGLCGGTTDHHLQHRVVVAHAAGVDLGVVTRTDMHDVAGENGAAGGAQRAPRRRLAHLRPCSRVIAGTADRVAVDPEVGGAGAQWSHHDDDREPPAAGDQESRFVPTIDNGHGRLSDVLCGPSICKQISLIEVQGK